MSSAEERHPGVPDDLLRVFSERIAKSLEEEPLDLEVVEHRRRVGRLLQTIDALTHYDLLEVASGAGASEVQAAFLATGRLVHPSNEKRLGLPGLGARLKRLLARVVEAYLTLSDPDRCKEYTQSLPVPPFSRYRPQDLEGRRRERQRLGRKQFHQALNHEADGDIYMAIQVAEQAALMHASAEVFELLGRCQSKNPAWLGRALTSYERALELEPGRRDLRERVRALHEDRGDIVGAMEQKEVLEGAPAPARPRGATPPPRRTPTRGLVGRWAARLGRWLSSLDE